MTRQRRVRVGAPEPGRHRRRHHRPGHLGAAHARPTRAAPTPPAAGAATATTAATARRGRRPADTLPPPGPVFRNATPCSTYYGQKAATSVPQILDEPAHLRAVRLQAGPDPRAPTGSTTRSPPATTAGAPRSRSSTPSPRRRSCPTPRPTPRRNDPGTRCADSQFAQSLPASLLVRATSATPPAGTARRPSTSRRRTPRHPRPTSCTSAASSCQDADLNAALNTVVDNELAQVVSNSYGSVGEPSSTADVADEHQTLLQAAAQGISVMFSSGDNGDEVANTGTRQVDYAASDPWATAVGGTALAVTKDDGYGFEQGWGTGKSTLTKGAWTPSRRPTSTAVAAAPAGCSRSRRTRRRSSRPRSPTTSARAPTAPCRTWRWSVTPTPGSSSARARRSPTAR